MCDPRTPGQAAGVIPPPEVIQEVAPAALQKLAQATGKPLPNGQTPLPKQKGK
jgi:hypothetical protein